MRILNLGAGVQSTTVFLMAHEGVLPMIDYAIFADTQEEPDAVYEHLAWLRTVPAPVPLIHVGTAGKLGDDLLGIAPPSPRAGTVFQARRGRRFASIPAFTAEHHETRQGTCREGMVRRQCTKEYKIEVVDRIIRRDILGMKPRQRIPKGTMVEQIIGISWDEKHRSEAIVERFAKIKWADVSFPLIKMKMTRNDCKDWLKTRVPHTCPRSACVFCPFKSSAEWLLTKANPREWARAVEIDRGLRQSDSPASRRLEKSLYLHRQCIPLDMVDLEAQANKEAAKKQTPLFDMMQCAEGMCGV